MCGIITDAANSLNEPVRNCDRRISCICISFI